MNKLYLVFIPLLVVCFLMTDIRCSVEFLFNTISKNFFISHSNQHHSLDHNHSPVKEDDISICCSNFKAIVISSFHFLFLYVISYICIQRIRRFISDITILRHPSFSYGHGLDPPLRSNKYKFCIKIFPTHAPPHLYTPYFI